jgi:beta-lactamase regulating signal transducer with metallopeptidase domain
MIEALAWTLVHSLWEVALVGLLICVLLPFLRQASARYVGACAAMLLMLILPLITFVILAGDVPATSPSRASLSSIPLLPVAVMATTAPAAWMPLLVLVWASGVGLFSLRMAGGLMLAYLRSRKAVMSVPLEVRQAVFHLATRFGLRRAVLLRSSNDSVTPSVVGWIKPVIVLPAAVLKLPFEQVEALLAHELAHIRRHDFLINLMQHAVETLLFYHPVVWWLGRRIREERENCCDDLAVAICGDRVIYARALTSLEELRAPVSGLSIAASGGSLVRRVGRLLGKHQNRFDNPSLWLVAVITVCGAAVLATVLKAEQRSATQAVLATPPIVSLAPILPTVPQAVGGLPQNALKPLPVQTETPVPPARAEGSSPQSYINELAEAGYSDLSVDDLIKFKIHGVTGDYARSLKAIGFQPSPSDLVALRIHGVTAEFAQALQAGGFANVTIQQLVSGRIHGVSPDVAEQLKAVGFDALTFDDVVAARIHGLSPEFVRDLKDVGFSSLTFDQAIAARIHGVETQMARELRDTGLSNLSFNDLIAARIHGVTPDFVRRAQQLGLKDLTFEKLVQLKIHRILD